MEIAVDLIKLHDLYDSIIVFSGDGDVMYVLRYLKETFNKASYVFAARNHVGSEIMDGVKDKVVDKLLFAEDFEYRLNMERFKYR